MANCFCYSCGAGLVTGNVFVFSLSALAADAGKEVATFTVDDLRLDVAVCGKCAAGSDMVRLEEAIVAIHQAKADARAAAEAGRLAAKRAAEAARREADRKARQEAARKHAAAQVEARRRAQEARLAKPVEVRIGQPIRERHVVPGRPGDRRAA